jgi:hypothetical protein
MFIIARNQLLIPLLAVTSIAIAIAPAAARASTPGDISPAQVLNTSPLWADTKSYHACNVVNVSTSSQSISLEIIESDGAVLATSGSTPITVLSGSSTEISAGASYVGFARCRVTTYNGTGTIRANLTVFHANTDGTYQTYAVSEAR